MEENERETDKENENEKSGKQEMYDRSMRSYRSFWIGILVGVLTAFALVTAGAVIKLVLSDVNGLSIKNSAQQDASVTDSAVTEKLGVLETAIDDYFWKDVDRTKLQDGVYRGLLESLDDPYSVYYTHEELVELQQQTEGIYYGIGAYISRDNETGYVKISKIIKDTPAEESSLMAGDYIYMIDGEDMKGRDSSYVVSKIKGEEHTFVTITVIREGSDEPIDISVERRKIESPTVEYEMYDNNIAYIQITEFDLVTSSQFENAYNSAKSDGMKALIIDLRGNPGGNLSTVCDIARMLLPKGLIVYTEDKYNKREEYKCDGKNEIQVPLAVLTDGYSASASEILAGAIKDYNIGTLVGTTTFGKGIVQKVVSLSDGSAVKLTVSSYFTPNGNNIHNIGIEPDIEVEFDAKLYAAGTDNQLEAAKAALMEQLKNGK